MSAPRWEWPHIPHDAKTPHDIIRQADEMMYLVKNTTRDNIGIAQRGVMK